MKFLIFTTLSIACTQGILQFSENTDKKMDCLSKILVKYNEAYTFAVSDGNLDAKVNNSMILYNQTKLRTTPLFGKFNMFVFSSSSAEAFDKSLSTLYNSWYWNSRAMFLLVLTEDNFDEMAKIFKTAWNYLVYNITIIANDDNTTNLYTFYPYKDDNCGEYNHYEVISSCDSLENVFPAKIPRNFHGCEIKMMPFILPPYAISYTKNRFNPSIAGIEITVMSTIAKHMNFTEVYFQNTHIHWGYTYSDGTYSMMFKELIDHKIDIIFGFFLGNSSYKYVFDQSFCHLTDIAVWFFPTALQMAQWKNLTAIFEGKLWLMIFLMIVINGSAWWIVGRKREKEDEFNDLTICVMHSLYALLQGSVKGPKRGNVRLMFAIWGVCGLLIFTAHQCQLISILTNPLFDKQIETLPELFKTKSEFGFYPIVLDAYMEDKNWINDIILTKYIPCTLTAECLNRTAFKRDFAVVKNSRQVRIFLQVNVGWQKLKY